MASSEKFCLKWNDFESNVSIAFRELRDDRDFFDVTLACEDDQIQAHKVILSACSPFFKNLLRRNPHQHPLLYLKGISFREIQSVLNFMYHGEANIAQDDLNSFLSVAEDLKVKGLTQGSNSETPKPKTEPSRQFPAKEKPSFRKPVPSSIPPPAEDDDIQEVSSVPIKQELDSGASSVAASKLQPQYGGYSQDTQVATSAEFDDGQYYDEYDESYSEEYHQAGAVANVVDKGYRVQLSFDQLDLFIEENRSKIGPNWSCNICGQSSINKSDVSKHIESKHVTLPPLSCQLCHRNFKTRESLRKHELYSCKNV